MLKRSAAPAANNSLLHITRNKVLNSAINLYVKVMAADAVVIIDTEKERRLAYYKYNHELVLQQHAAPLSFDRKSDPWLCEKWGSMDDAMQRKNNYFLAIQRLEVLYLMRIPCCIAATFIITKHGVYCLRNLVNRTDWVECPIYLFHEELTITQLQILDQLKKLALGDDLPAINTFEKQTLTKMVWVQKYRRGDESACRRFESILRLIPGEYRNGNWKQLDGFFGVYYHTLTHECTDIFPETVHD